MSDVKDILGVAQKGPGQAEGSKPAQAEKKPEKPKWMSREAFALLDTSHPIAPSALDSAQNAPKGLKEKPKVSSRGKVTWQWQGFQNPARGDKLVLNHWVKCYKDPSGRIRNADDGEYPFAKFNKKAGVITYTDEEYDSLLGTSDVRWSRAETDHLMDLCAQFDLRWNVIADRFKFEGGPQRTIEDLKARYYSLTKILLTAREGDDAVANHELIRNPYNFAHEMDRKRHLAIAWQNSTGIENPEDARVLEEAAAIEARQAAESKAARASVVEKQNRPDAALAMSGVTKPEAPAEEGFPSLFNEQGVPVKPKPGVYVRSVWTQEVANKQVAGLIGGARAQKTVDVTLAELGITGPPQNTTRAVCGAWLALRAEVIEVLELKKKLQNKQGQTGAGAEGDKRGKRGRGGKGTAGDDGRPGKRRAT